MTGHEGDGGKGAAEGESEGRSGNALIGAGHDDVDDRAGRRPAKPPTPSIRAANAGAVTAPTLTGPGPSRTSLTLRSAHNRALARCVHQLLRPLE